MTAQPPTMRPEDVPDEWMQQGRNALARHYRSHSGPHIPTLEGAVRAVLAAVIPAIRAAIADEIERAGHDTHRHVGDAWTTLDRLDGHVLVGIRDLADVILVASGLVLPGTARSAVDRLNAALTEAVQEADQ